ncbi:hypothetical protein FHL15_007346 [Xylaria flabelliformis]|uniref:Uncharacterized protein n=1 Tax=Xylaria flabelliformis TaxID=2512241 RepID=A0A553HV36_9PEZI|nr:hypothetical protein FHL15_007346 [Xylaria flabelliformis]
MEAQQSKEPCYGQGPQTTHPGVSQNGDYVSPPYTPDKREEEPPSQQLSCLPSMTDPSAVQKATFTPESTPPCPSIPDGFKGSQNNEGRTPETAIIIDSDSEEASGNLLRQHQNRDIAGINSESDEDLFTLLRKHRTKNIHKVTRQDNWESLNIALCEDTRIHGKKTRKTGKHTSRSKNRKHRQLVDVEYRHNARSEPDQSFRSAGAAYLPPSSCKNKRKRTYPPDQRDRLDAYQTTKKRRVDDQTTKSHTKRSKKSGLAPFRQANRSLQVHADATSETVTPEEFQKGKYISARIDSGELLKDTRLFTTPEPRAHKPRPSDVSHKHDQPSCSRSQSEERNAALIQKYESRQHAREYVVPELKWRYIIKYVDIAEIILDDEDMKKKTKSDMDFADRQKANRHLYNKKSLELVGGFDAIARQTTTLEGPEQLLKMDIMSTDGKHFLAWVERDQVVLKKLKKKKREQQQWRPTPRPKIPHYVVECDLLTYDPSLVPPCENDEDGAMGSDDRDGGLGSLRLNIGLTAEKFERKSFSIREMANDYAAKLFLENTRVNKWFATSSDIRWWRENALPEHKKAMSEAREPGGLYELGMDVHDMNSRLGWDQITVHVREVDDIVGPANF